MNVDEFTLQTHKALLNVSREAQNTPTPKGAAGRRSNAPIARAVGRRGIGPSLPFMRHAGGRTLQQKPPKALKPQLPVVDEDRRASPNSMAPDFGMSQDFPDSFSVASGEDNHDVTITSADLGDASDAGSGQGSSKSASLGHSEQSFSERASGSRKPKSNLGSGTVSYSASMMTSRASSPKQTGMLTAALRAVDNPMPFSPFCQKCAPIRPTDCLCLKPECDISRIMLNPQSFTAGGKASAQPGGGNPPRRRSSYVRSSIQKIKDQGPKKWAMALEALKLADSVPTSNFEGCGVDDDERPFCLCKDDKKPPVLKTLTPWEITLLECWAIQHVKKQFLDLCVIAHEEAPAEKNRHRDNMHSATICQLVRKAAKKQLDDVEWAFMIARLRHFPLIRDLPEGMIEDFAEKLDVRTYGKGSTIFKRGEQIDGFHILVQGDVELTDGDVDAITADNNVKSAPSVILLEDAIIPDKARPFLLKHQHQRIRSRTLKAWDDDEAGTTAMLIWLPFKLVEKAAKFWRKREARDRIDLIVKIFAPALRLDKHMCEKHRDIFELETFHMSDAILQQGSKPAIEDARLMMIIHGEVKLVRNAACKRTPKTNTKDNIHKIGPGKVLGESSLYGEPFPHYAFVATKTLKVLSLRVWDFFEKLLCRNPHTPLEKPIICAATLLYKTDDGRVADSEVNEADLAEVKRKHDNDAKREALESSRIQWMAQVQADRASIRIALDNAAVKAEEWKTVPEKYMLKWRQPPACRPPKCISSAAYPRDFDLFPSAQRSVFAGQRSSCSVDDTSLLTTAVPSRALNSSVSGSEDWMFSSLDGKIKKALIDAEELDAEHYLHSAFGIFMEDADRPHTAGTTAMQQALRRSSQFSMASARPSTTPGGDRNSFPRPRNAVLMTCGNLTAR